jgi:hypothetical protein
MGFPTNTKIAPQFSLKTFSFDFIGLAYYKGKDILCLDPL